MPCIAGTDDQMKGYWGEKLIVEYQIKSEIEKTDGIYFFCTTQFMKNSNLKNSMKKYNYNFSKVLIIVVLGWFMTSAAFLILVITVVIIIVNKHASFSVKWQSSVVKIWNTTLNKMS